jgi:CheY-like chemotaxis protein
VITEIRTILLAEDNANDVELTLAALRAHRIANEVVTTRDGAETLDYLYKRNGYAGRASSNPALILLDLKMPKVDGIEVLRQVKGDPHLHTIPVVVLTSSREEQDLVATYDLGVNAYVSSRSSSGNSSTRSSCLEHSGQSSTSRRPSQSRGPKSNASGGQRYDPQGVSQSAGIADKGDTAVQAEHSRDERAISSRAIASCITSFAARHVSLNCRRPRHEVPSGFNGRSPVAGSR